MVRHNRQHKSIIQSFLTYEGIRSRTPVTNTMIVVIKTLNLLTYFKISVVSLLSGRNLVLQFYF